MKKLTGFATLTLEERIDRARAGGLKAHQLGKAHKWTSETAQIAGRKGGAIKRAKAALKRA